MESNLEQKKSDLSQFRVLWIVFFFQGMAPGAWIPSLTNILTELGLASWVTLAFMIPPLCAMVAPLAAGAAADQRMSSERLFLWCTGLSVLTLGMAFLSLDLGWHPVWFLLFLAANSLLTAPTWGLLTNVSLTHLPKPERSFPLVRVGATFGWIAGGLMTSYLLQADRSVMAGYSALGSKLVVCFVGLYLPRTPPMGSMGKTWGERMGAGAFRLFRARDHAVFFLVTAVFSIPLMALYMYSPEFLRILGDPRPSGTMTIAQLSEVVSMFVLGALLTRVRVKTVLLWALGLSALRYGFSAYAGTGSGMAWHVLGIALHGVCYTFFFVTAQVFLSHRVSVDLKAQAQGLLNMVSNGIDPLVGALFCGWLRFALVRDDGRGWDLFWAILGGIILVCLVFFAVLYRGQKADESSVEMPSPPR